MKTLLLLSLLVISRMVVFANGNENGVNTKYRITAVKNGDRTIISQSNISEVTIPLAVYIPNAFSPNGDGLNDRFGISAKGIDKFSITVFNKWGQLIFESTDPHQTWDGTFGGEIVPDGPYVYSLHLVSSDNIPSVKSGTVTIVK